MKLLLLTGAALAASSTALFAQSLTVTAPGYSATKLFDSSAGFTITGLAADGLGNVFYIESDGDNSDGLAPSVLYRRSRADSFSTPLPLFTYSAAVFGSFVTISGGTVYFGESSTNQLFAIKTDGTGLDLLATVVNNYDGALQGGSLYLSHNPTSFPNPPANKVSKFDFVSDGTGGLMLGAADTIIDTGSDYSGPIEFGVDGSLYYGATAFNGLFDLYAYTSAEVAAAVGASSLTLDAAHRTLANGLNGYLAAGSGAALWQSNFSSLNLIDTIAQTSVPVATSAQSIGQLDFAGGELFASVTRFSGPQVSAVYSVVPEPSSAALLALGLTTLVRRRRQR